jgi:hypothetical protein
LTNKQASDLERIRLVASAAVPYRT